jgi:hypothetical protein
MTARLESNLDYVYLEGCSNIHCIHLHLLLYSKPVSSGCELCNWSFHKKYFIMQYKHHENKKQLVKAYYKFLTSSSHTASYYSLTVQLNGDVQTSPEGKQNDNTCMPWVGFKLIASQAWMIVCVCMKRLWYHVCYWSVRGK